jgi:membrane protein YdbS with pleckstrin-like domain
MSLDPTALKKRRTVMFALNALALLAAFAAIVGYFKFAQPWALAAFVAALLMGFGAQIWFIAGLRRTSKGA